MSWALFSGTAFNEAYWYLHVLDRKCWIGDSGDQSSRRGPANLGCGMIDHGDRRSQGVGHGEITEPDQREVGTTVRVQGGHDAQ
jgi:hypothetical protein